MREEGIRYDGKKRQEASTFVENEANIIPRDMTAAPPQLTNLTALSSLAMKGLINTPKAQLNPYPTITHRLRVLRVGRYLMFRRKRWRIEVYWEGGRIPRRYSKLERRRRRCLFR